MTTAVPTPPPLPRTRAPDWLERNWKWFVPLAGLIFLGCVAAFAAFILGVMKSSDAYSGALARARAAPAAIVALGTPIKEGWLVTGNIHVSGSSGQAALAIPVAGPRGSATLYVEASKSMGEWHFDRLVLQVDRTNEWIDIIAQEETTGRSPPPAGAPGPRG